MSAKNNKPRALVIGGSLGGLCAGVCLRAAGWCVSIFERSTGLMDDRGAGIVLQFEVLNREADELPALLTDRTGRKRRTSVPPGMVCPEHWQKQMDIARAFLPPQLRELLEATQMEMALNLRNYGIRAGNQSQFPRDP